MASKRANYLSNSTLTPLVLAWQQDPNGEHRELWTAVYVIARNCWFRFQNKHRYEDDGISEGVIYVLKYLNRYDPTNPKANAFAYITQACKLGFLTYLSKETAYNTKLRITDDVDLDQLTNNCVLYP